MTTRHYVALRKVDLGSEFLRFLGPNRGWVVAVWKWLFPVFQASVYISTYLHIYISTYLRIYSDSWPRLVPCSPL